MKKIILFFAILLLISACSSIPEIDTDLQLRQWQRHQALINKIESWNIKGRAAIQNENNSATFFLHWDQFNTDYELHTLMADDIDSNQNDECATTITDEIDGVSQTDLLLS